MHVPPITVALSTGGYIDDAVDALAGTQRVRVDRGRRRGGSRRPARTADRGCLDRRRGLLGQCVARGIRSRDRRRARVADGLRHDHRRGRRRSVGRLAGARGGRGAADRERGRAVRRFRRRRPDADGRAGRFDVGHARRVRPRSDRRSTAESSSAWPSRSRSSWAPASPSCGVVRSRGRRVDDDAGMPDGLSTQIATLKSLSAEYAAVGASGNQVAAQTAQEIACRSPTTPPSSSRGSIGRSADDQRSIAAVEYDDKLRKLTAALDRDYLLDILTHPAPVGRPRRPRPRGAARAARGVGRAAARTSSRSTPAGVCTSRCRSTA